MSVTSERKTRGRRPQHKRGGVDSGRVHRGGSECRPSALRREATDQVEMRVPSWKQKSAPALIRECLRRCDIDEFARVIVHGDQAGALGLLAGAPGLALRCLAGGATKWGAEEYFLDEIAASGAPATPVG